MQGSFEDIYNRLSNSLQQDIYYYDKNDIMDDYEILTYSTLVDIDKDDNPDSDIVNMELLNESQLILTDKNIKDNVIVFNTNIYIDKIAKSFKYNLSRIDCQFDLDYDRSEHYFNNLTLSKKVFINELNKFKKYNIDINSKNKFPLSKILLMLFNQSSLAYSFLLMCKMYNNIQTGIYVTSNNCIYRLNETENNCYNIELNAIFNLKDTNKNVVISEINIVTDIDIIFKNDKYELSKLGIIYWNSQDIH